MKRSHIIILGLIIFAGVFGGLLLIPDQQEVALMQLKGKDWETARASYEALIEAGNLSSSVVRPLAELYLESGRVDAAIELMERYTTSNPDDLQALHLLDRYYQQGQRPQAQLVNLERIYREDASQESLQRLVRGYGIQSHYERQMTALENLVQDFDPAPKYYRELALLQASRGKLSKAIATLHQLEKDRSEAFTEEDFLLQFHLLLDTSQIEKAFQMASSWLAGHSKPLLAAHLAQIFQSRDHVQPALDLLEPFSSAANSQPALLAQIVSLEIKLGRRDKVYSRLQRLHQAGRLPVDLVAPFVDLALDNNQIETAFQTAKAAGWDTQPAWLLARLAQSAMGIKDLKTARNLMGRLDEQFLAGRPLLAAAMAITLNHDMTSARHWMAKVRLSTLSHEEKVVLAGLDMQIGRQKEAFRLLTTVLDREGLPDGAFRNLARLYLHLGKAKEGFRLFDRLRSRKNSPSLEFGWILLAAGSSHAGIALNWLDTPQSSTRSAAELRDLYHVAMDHQETGLAVAVAGVLLERQDGKTGHFLMGNALLAQGKTTKALEHLRHVVPGGTEEEATYLRALVAAWKQGRLVEVELRGFIRQRLARGKLSQTQQLNLVQVALDLGEYRSALPYLPELARKKGGTWLSAYIEAAARAGRQAELVAFLKADLTRVDLSLNDREMRIRALFQHGGAAAAAEHLRRFAVRNGGQWASLYADTLLELGRREELLAFLKQRVARTDLTREERRSIGYRSLQVGNKELAEKIFFQLAQDAPPDSPDVSQVLYLWGPRPGTKALDWLESRARQSEGKERAAWMKRLIQAGAADRVVAMGGVDPSS